MAPWFHTPVQVPPPAQLVALEPASSWHVSRPSKPGMQRAAVGRPPSVTLVQLQKRPGWQSLVLLHPTRMPEHRPGLAQLCTPTL